MKKASKILLFTLLGSVVAILIAFFAISGSKGISNLGIVLEGIHSGFVSMKNNHNATFAAITGTFILFAVGLGILYAIQIRRKKTKAFVYYAWILLASVYAIIMGGSDLKNAVTSLSNSSLKIVLLVGLIVVALQLFANAVLTVAFTFEASDLQANSKKSDFNKIADLVFALVLVVLYVPILFYISGGKFDVFKNFFTKTLAAKNGVLPIILVVVELFIAGFAIYKLIRQRKTVLGPLFVLFGEFVGYTYFFYSNKKFTYSGISQSQLEHGFTSYLTSGNILNILIVIGITLYLLMVIFYAIYQLADTFILFFENKRQKLYNHREKYVYGDRRRFGDSIVKEWENSKNQQYAQSFSHNAMPAGLEEFEEIVETNQNKDLNDLGIDNDALLAEQGAKEEISTNEAKEDDLEDTKKAIKLNLNEEAAAQDFRVKLMMLEPEKQARYNTIRNKLQSYKKIKQKFSKTVDSYRYAGELVAKISVLGSTLRLHLALDPDSYDVEKYHQIDLSSKSKYIFVPFTLKLKGPKSVELAIQLIEELMSGFDIPENPNYKEADYVSMVQKELEAEQQ
ncbi:MAG: hypothetical protein ACI35W_03895 [Anaeroplasmataceae bacterium]